MSTMSVWLLDGFQSTENGFARPSSYGDQNIVAADGRPDSPRRGGVVIGQCYPSDGESVAKSIAVDLGATELFLWLSPYGRPKHLVLKGYIWRAAPLRLEAVTTMLGSRLLERTYPDPDENPRGVDGCRDLFVAEVRAAFPNVLRRQNIRVRGGPYDMEIGLKL